LGLQPDLFQYAEASDRSHSGLIPIVPYNRHHRLPQWVVLGVSKRGTFVPLRLTLTSAFSCLLLLSACNRASIQESPKELREKAFTYSNLELTNGTRHQALHDELERVKTENGFPLTMTSQRVNTEQGLLAWKKPGAKPIPDADNFVVAILTAIPVDRRARLQRQLERSYPDGALRLSTLQLEHIHDVLADWQTERNAIQNALKLQRSDFGVSYSQGLLADLNSVNVVMMAHRLLAEEAINAAYGGDLQAATLALPNLFRISAALAAESNLTMRIAAARLRQDGLRIVEFIAHHPDVQEFHIGAMQSLISNQLQSWTEDAEAWRGERAIGLHAYEMVRDGQILSLLTTEESKQVLEQGPQRFGRAIQKNLDEDELFYLRTMRKVIEICRDPYFKRLKSLTDLGAELESRRKGSNQAFVADLLLKKDLQWGQRQQAVDRAAMEAWLIALSSSKGVILKQQPVNPLTGRAYRIVEEGSRIEVYDVNLTDEVADVWSEPLVVPVFYR
jgi:hypothetical protein